MVEGKLFKTRLCLLYQRGRCSRQHCNYAHGDSELRRSFNGREEDRGGRDLRERLDRKRSPLHRSSPGREDAKARHSSHGDSPRSPGRRIDRNHRKRKQFDGHDHSGSFRMSDGAEDQMKNRRQSSYDTKIRTDEQARELHSVIETLDNDKRQLEIYLKDKVQETDTLASKVQELEMQLSKEKEEGRRFTTKIKLFIKAHNRHLWLQDELKKSHIQLQKLGEQLNLDAVGLDNEDNLNIKITSDDEAGGYALCTMQENQMNSSPRKKRPRVILEAHDALNQVNIVNGERTENGKTRLEKLSHKPDNHDQLSNSKKPETAGDAYNRHRPSVYEDKSRRGKHLPADIAYSDKYRVSETGPKLPSTGIAAHILDEDVEMNGKFQVVGEGSTRAENGVTLKLPRPPFLPPPPPPIPHNAYLQYKGDDEYVDIDAVDEDSVQVDIV